MSSNAASFLFFFIFSPFFISVFLFFSRQNRKSAALRHPRSSGRDLRFGCTLRLVQQEVELPVHEDGRLFRDDVGRLLREGTCQTATQPHNHTATQAPGVGVGVGVGVGDRSAAALDLVPLLSSPSLLSHPSLSPARSA
jgi:hypothetical protein